MSEGKKLSLLIDLKKEKNGKKENKKYRKII